jgi:hypothetical protein
VKIGHVLLGATDEAGANAFARLVEGLDRLAISQHVLVSDIGIARRLDSRPYVTVGPIVRSPIMAYCLMPPVDLVHVHDLRSGQAGLLLTLTRSIPYVLSAAAAGSRDALQRSITSRARRLVTSEELEAERLVERYREAIAAWSEFPQDANCG